MIPNAISSSSLTVHSNTSTCCSDQATDWSTSITAMGASKAQCARSREPRQRVGGAWRSNGHDYPGAPKGSIWCLERWGEWLLQVLQNAVREVYMHPRVCVLACVKCVCMQAHVPDFACASHRTILAEWEDAAALAEPKQHGQALGHRIIVFWCLITCSAPSLCTCSAPSLWTCLTTSLCTHPIPRYTTVSCLCLARHP